MPSIPRLAVALFLAALVFFPTDCSAQTVDQRKPSLRERLIAGLQVRRPSEFEFVDAVIDTVERGELPQRLVDRFYFWARNRAPRSRAGRRPIVYFQPGLTIQAAKLRITIQETP